MTRKSHNQNQNVPTDRVDTLVNYLSGLGDPVRDSGAASRPAASRPLSEAELNILYADNDLAATIVDEIVEDALRAGFDVRSDEQELLVDDLYRIHAYEKIIAAAKQARLTGQAYLVMHVRDGRAAQDPLGRGSLLSLTQVPLYPKAINNDAASPDFGQPVLYRTANDDVVFHASRVLVFRGEWTPWGYHSVLQRTWAPIRRLTDIENALARLIQSFEVAVIRVGGLSEAIIRGDEDIVTKRMELIARSRSLINAVMLDADLGEVFERNVGSVAGLADVWGRFALSVARAARMPMVKLFGEAPSGLNTDGDSGRKQWNGRVEAYRKHELTPQIDRLCAVLFNGREPDKWSVQWPPLDVPTQREVAEVRKLVAETDAIYLDRGVRTAQQVARSRDGESEWSMETEAPSHLQPMDNVPQVGDGTTEDLE